MNRNIVPIAIYHLLEEDERRNEMRIYRIHLRDAQDPFAMPEHEFKTNFRLNPELVSTLIDWISPHAIEDRRCTRLPFHLRVLATLHFLAKGSYQQAVGGCCWLSMSQASISRCINEVCRLIVNVLMPEWVKFTTTPADKANVKQKFYEKFNFRGVLGCIDGTHIAIVPPSITDEDHPPHLYVNMKGFHSINVMMVCDSERKVITCDARFPGSVHDSAVWRVQHLRNYLREEYNNGDKTSIIIGDSGYGLEPWLFTPFLHAAEGTPEALFNNQLRPTRNIIERTFGTLKGGWRALLHHRVLHYHPADAAYITYASVVLHNIAIWANIEFDEANIAYDNEVEAEEVGNVENNDENVLQIARIARANYIRRNLV